MVNQQRRKRSVVALLVGVLAITGCAPTLDLQTAAIPDTSQAVVVSDSLGKTDVDFRKAVSLSAQNGRLTSVAITGPDGQPVPGSLGNQGTTWEVPPRALAMSTEYSVSTTTVDRYGLPSVSDSTFTTMTPTNVLGYSFSLSNGATYGVGMPLSVQFNKPVADKAAVERLLEVNTSNPVEGAWNWQGDRTVTYRPKEYWPAGTTVTVAANLRGVEPEPDLFALENKSMSFKIGSSFIAVVDAQTHQMTVSRNGETVRTIPITTGKPGWETRSGIKVAMSKNRRVIMDAATLGVPRNSPEYYRLNVDYAVRVTSSGEFVHAAPWSVESQGVRNVSHGCVGMATSHAEWFYDNVKIGDIIQVTNTGRRQNLGNGITVWNVSWDSWRAGSALSAA